MGKQANAKKDLTVKEIKQIAPLAEVYQLDRYSKYLVFVPVSDLVGGRELALQRAKEIVNSLRLLNIAGVVMLNTGDIQMFELKEEKKI